jgi:hypothetical protein
MLRITQISRKYPSTLDLMKEGGQTETVLTVTMEAEVAEFGHVTVELSMRERETDEILLADAKRLAREAIAELHADLQRSLPTAE